MNKENLEYYKEQLNKINFHSLYSPKVKFVDEDGSTNFLQLNKESAKAIINKLKKEFNL
jgi:phage antirepressor YoqD-like protein